MRSNNQDIRKAQAFLSLIILIGVIITTTGIALILIVISTVNSSYGFQASQAAQAAATAGIEDALVEIDRNNALAGTVTTGYGLGGVIPSVAVTQNVPASGEVTVISGATVSGATRKITVVLSENQLTGVASIISWQNTL